MEHAQPNKLINTKGIIAHFLAEKERREQTQRQREGKLYPQLGKMTKLKKKKGQSVQNSQHLSGGGVEMRFLCSKRMVLIFYYNIL